MAWTAPKTWTVGEIVTAAMLNQHIRDNLLESTSAKAVAAGDMFYATAANTIVRLAKGTAGQMLEINASETALRWGSSMLDKKAVGAILYNYQNNGGAL